MASFTAAAQPVKDSASKAIGEAESAIDEMRSMGFGVTYANDTLNEAKLLFSQERYIAAETVAKNVPEIKATAINVKELIDSVEARIYDLRSKGYNVSAAVSLFNSSLTEFNTDNYIESEKSLNLAMGSLDETEAKESSRRATEMPAFDFLPVILDNLMLVIFIFIIGLIAGLRGRRLHERRKIKKKSKMLETERKMLISEIKNVQEKYFRLGTISKPDYNASTDKYNRKLDEIKNELSLLKGETH
jgi:hypothetical protein